MTTAPIVLGLEASAGIASAAVLQAGAVLAECRHEARHGHAAWMLDLVRDSLIEAAIPIDRISAVVAGRGPGSFTGIRVALAAAKGLMLARDLPGYGVSSLAAMAAAASDGRAPVAALADTRRGSLFVGCFAADGTPLADSADCAPDQLAGHLADLSSTWRLTGHLDPALLGDLQVGGLAIDPLPAEPLARHLGLVLDQVDLADAAETMPLTPLYLSEPLLGPR